MKFTRTPLVESVETAACPLRREDVAAFAAFLREYIELDAVLEDWAIPPSL